jgi:hypothetical protein
LDLTLEIGEVNQYFEVVGKSAEWLLRSRSHAESELEGTSRKQLVTGSADYPEELVRQGFRDRAA